MVNKYCTTCQHERNSIGFCDKCCYSRLCEEKGLAPTMYEKRPSNADRIRAMSDEELAEYLIRDVEAEAIRRVGRYLTNIEIDRAVVDWLDWLKAEVDE